MSEEILYTPEEVAKKLKLSKYTIYEMIKRGDIKAHHIGRSIRIAESQLQLYIMGTTRGENVYEAEIIQEGGEKYAVVSEEIKICVSTELEGRVKVSIDPEDIILGTSLFVSSARNIFSGKVINIIPGDRSVKVILDIGVPISALITKRSMSELNIQTGNQLYAIFKTMAVKVIR